MAKTVNGFKTKLEWERAKKMGLFLDWCLLDLEAVTEFRSSHPASILQVSIVVMLNELQIFEASVSPLIRLAFVSTSKWWMLNIPSSFMSVDKGHTIQFISLCKVTTLKAHQNR